LTENTTIISRLLALDWMFLDPTTDFCDISSARMLTVVNEHVLLHYKIV